jgi:sulfatase maturation enzyme AslB (radical SAM superfamily)
LKNIPTPEELRNRIGRRKVCIWGARHDGYAACLVLQRHGISIDSFIDSSHSLQGTTTFGLDIHLPEFFFEQHNAADSFIVIASGFHADEIAAECMAHGFVPDIDFVIQGELRQFNYQVDISGSCNLKCISCPRGNFDEHRSKGFMGAETYRNLLEKILRDDPYTGIITLYNWGEPLLNRELPKIIEITNENKILSAISSNLSIRMNFEPVIAAKPTWFRISTSGWGDNYEITHTGGKWDLLYANVHLLKEYKEKHHPEMIVEVFYHIYDHNRDDYLKWQTLCDELGFVLRCRHAALAPLDNIEAIIDGRTVNARVEKTQELQFLKVSDVMKKAYEERHRPCYYERHLWITWDLNVAQCMEWYRPDLNLVEGSFMDVSPEELIRARDESQFCVECKRRGIHRCFVVYSEEKLIDEKQSVPLKKAGV